MHNLQNQNIINLPIRAKLQSLIFRIESIDKLIPKNQKKAQAGQDWLQELNAGQPQQGVLQQMQPLLNQLLLSFDS